MIILLSVPYTGFGQDISGWGEDDAIHIKVATTHARSQRMEVADGDSVFNDGETAPGQDSVRTRIMPRRTNLVPDDTAEKESVKPSDNPKIKRASGLRELDLKDPAEQFRFGVRCYKGDKYVQKNDTLAFYWWNKSAMQGYTPAQNQLGICYRYGDGVEQDDQKAVYWWKKAVEKDNKASMMHLGNCYAFGLGVEEDDTTAVRLFERAATTGHYM